jgi:hypothetical protein
VGCNYCRSYAGVTFINRGIRNRWKQEKCVGDLLKMYLKYAMEKRKASVETVDEAIRKMKYCCLITPGIEAK